MINKEFLARAEELKPVLIEEEITIAGSDRVLEDGDEIVFDFGNHYVGYLSIDFGTQGNHPDAPLMFAVQFAEIREELDQDLDAYHGWISRSWIQREIIHADDLPCTVKLERRYAFRYVKIRILSTSSNYSVIVKQLKACTVSSADESSLKAVKMSEEDAKLDKAAVRTLHSCMQDVFEDGPKRDRRLWLGDLRLQALANYETFRRNDLVARCLYLFAGTTLEKGRLANNLFVRPEVECDYQTMFDYTLFFIDTLRDYYRETQDRKTLEDLEPVCMKQYELLSECFDENDLIDVKKAGNIFIDWNFTLDKQASGQAVWLYAMTDLVFIEKELGHNTLSIEADIGRKKKAALSLFDERKGLFVSGESRQVSWMSQVWMILAKAVDAEKGREILETLEKESDAVGMNSPYAYHHYIQALIDCGEKEKAYAKMHDYWGGMLENGSDTFWELYNPEDPSVSPYGGIAVHSFCHAWSCTPAYFLRKYYY